MVSLSERERIRTFDRLLRRQMLYPAELRTLVFENKSGRQDSNLRPPGPKPGAMTGLRYAPIEGHLKQILLRFCECKDRNFFWIIKTFYEKIFLATESPKNYFAVFLNVENKAFF